MKFLLTILLGKILGLSKIEIKCCWYYIVQFHAHFLHTWAPTVHDQVSPNTYPPPCRAFSGLYFSNFQDFGDSFYGGNICKLENSHAALTAHTSHTQVHDRRKQASEKPKSTWFRYWLIYTKNTQSKTEFKQLLLIMFKSRWLLVVSKLNLKYLNNKY